MYESSAANFPPTNYNTVYKKNNENQSNGLLSTKREFSCYSSFIKKFLRRNKILGWRIGILVEVGPFFIYLKTNPFLQ